MAIDLNAIIDEWIEILQNDSNLSANLPENVKVYKAPRRIETILDKFAIFVYRDSLNEQDYHMGKSLYDVEPIIALACVVRSPFNPEKLEEYQNHLASNLLNTVFENKTNTLWSYAKHRGSQALTVRDENEQTYEIEIVYIKIGVFCID